MGCIVQGNKHHRQTPLNRKNKVMTQSNEPTIEQMNEVIALFMNQPRLHPSDRRWHKDWNCLMPVVEKIEKDCNAEVEISHCCCCVGVYPEGCDTSRGIVSVSYPEAKTKIEAVYKAVYQFITWFNQQKQTNET